MDSIRIKRGMSTELPEHLPLGELAFCIDTRELWVGSGDGLALKRVTNTEITQHLDEWNALYTEVDERFETKYIEVSTQFATKFDEICKQFSVKSDSLDRQFADKFEEICVQFSDKYAGLEAEYAKKLHNIDVLSSDNKESIDLLKRDIGTTENIEDLRQINNLATDTLNDLQAIREDLESDISEIGDFKEDVRKAHIDYSGTHHEKLKDSMDANVDFIMGEFNSVTHTGEYITAQDTILRHIKRAEMRGHTELNCIKEPSGKEVVLPYEFDETQKDFTLEDTKESGAVNIVLKGNTEVNVLKNPMRDYVVPYEFEEGYTATLTDTKETGSIQSAILKGQTLVNLVNDVTSNEVGNYNNSPCRINVIRNLQNETLTIIFNVISLEIPDGADGMLRIGGGWSGAIRHKPTVGINKVLYNCTQQSNNWLGVFSNSSSYEAGQRISISEVIVLEGDHTQEDIPYFEGMQSVKMPVLTTTGKNLFDGEYENGGIHGETGNNYDSDKLNRSINFIKVKPSTQYYLTKTTESRIYEYDKNKQYLQWQYGGSKTLSEKTEYIRISWVKTGSDNLIQLEEGLTATEYEPFKSNILTVNEEVTLRGIGNVQDELNLVTWDINQRFVEYILDGIDNDKLSYKISANRLEVTTNDILDNNMNNSLNIISDKMKNVSEYSQRASSINNSIALNGRICIKNDEVIVNSTLDDIKEWLKNNPIKVICLLKENSIKTVDLSILDQDGLSVPALSTYNEVTHINTTVPENSLKPLISSKTPEFPVMIKPNTKYSIVADTTTNGFDEIPLTYNLGGAEVETSVGEKLTVIQTPSTLENETFKVTGTGMKLSNVMILEKDLTGKEIPNYTEGMQSVKMPVLKTVGKNLFDKEKFIDKNQWSADSHGAYRSISLQLEPNTVYTMTRGSVSCTGHGLYVNVSNHRNSSSGSHWWLFHHSGNYNNQKSFTTNETGIIYFNSSTVDLLKDYKDLLNEVQLEKGDTVTSYEPHKSNILTVNEDVELRGIGDVKDTLDLTTGEVVERIGEVVYDGTENWTLHTTLDNVVYFRLSKRFDNYVSNVNHWGGNTKCNKFITMAWIDSFYLKLDKEFLSNDGANYPIISIGKEKLTSLTVDGFKQWLSQNPITVQYRLATESIKTVDFTITNQNGAKVTKLSTFNDVTHISTTVSEGALNPIISHKDLEYEVLLKPNTKYSIITNPISNGHPNSPISFDLGGQQVETTVGSYCTLVTTPNSLTHNKLVMRGRGNKLRGGVMIFEGDKTGMAFSHFDGMKSVENLTVRVNNANLIDKKDYCRQEQLIFDSGYSYKKFAYIQLKPRTEYVLTLRDLVIPAGNWNVLNVDGDNSDIGYATVYNYNQGNTETDRHVGNVTRIFMTDSTGRVRFSNYTQGGTNVTGTNYGALFGNLCSSITLQESQNIGDYVPQESNSLPLTIPMRSLPDGTCDTLNLLTGEYTRNIGYAQIDNELWQDSWQNNDVGYEDTIRFHIGKNDFYSRYDIPRTHSNSIYNTLFPSQTKALNSVWTAKEEAIAIHNGTAIQFFQVCMLKKNLAEPYLESFKQLLTDNPLCIQYPLETPITTKLDLAWEDGKLFAYDGITHFFVDVDGGHLQPVLDIDVPTDIVAELSRLRAERTELETSKASLESQITLLDKHNKELVSQVKQLSETNTQLANETKSLRNQTRVNKNNLNYTKSYLLEGQKVLEFNQEELQQEQERTKTEQQVQDQQILSSMLASTEIFELVLALMPMQLGNERQSTEGGSKMVEVYVTLIIAGEKTLEQVPALVRPKVEAQLKAMGVLA